MRRVLVCGRRTFGNVPPGTPEEDIPAAEDRARRERDFLNHTLGRMHAEDPIGVIIQGGGRGADYWAREWAIWHAAKVRTFGVEWKKYGRAAGPLRNARMIALGRPDLVIAFPGGDGTRDAIRKAEAAGVPVVKVAMA